MMSSELSSAARTLLRGTKANHRRLSVSLGFSSLRSRVNIQIYRTIGDNILDFNSRARSALPTFRRKAFTAFHVRAQSCAIYRIE
jgi:hypothetical protein